jgi:hypothetical protein
MEKSGEVSLSQALSQLRMNGLRGSDHFELY